MIWGGVLKGLDGPLSFGNAWTHKVGLALSSFTEGKVAPHCQPESIGWASTKALLEHYLFDFVLTQTTQPRGLLKEIVDKHDQGIVLKAQNSFYEHRHSAFSCKLRPFDTSECRVIGTEMGRGEFEGMLGALIVGHLDIVPYE